jgi:hypothetical protein
MKVKKENLWNSNADIILITTNSFIKNDGALAMGKGAALEMKTKYPLLPFDFGKTIREKYGHLKEYNIILESSIPSRFGIFQVKYHFKDSANIELIKRSILKLQIMASNNDIQFAMNYPGIGFGQLSEKDVFPLISMLSDNVTIYKL